MNDLKDVILSLEPEFTDDESFINALPVGVSLYLDNESYLIDLKLKGDLLEFDIWIGEDKYTPTYSDEGFFSIHLSRLLEDRLEIVKDYYEAERYEEKF